MLIAFMALLCIFSNFQHVFLSISHGTGCSISVSLYYCIPHPTPFSISMHSFIFASMNHISPFNNNRSSECDAWMTCEAMMTSTCLLVSLLLKVMVLRFATLCAFLVAGCLYLYLDILWLVGMSPVWQVILLTLCDFLSIFIYHATKPCNPLIVPPRTCLFPGS